MNRHLTWDGCANVRDLGGLRTRDGRAIRSGALVRADALDRLSAAGWAALEAHGVRTVIDLRNDDELGTDAAPRPAGLTTLHLPLDGVEDTEFWQDWHGRPEFGTPLYYRPFLDHFPERTAAVLTAIARAEPGGIAVHCGIGRDRTGLITILLLALVGVDLDGITADYALSEPRVPFGGVGDVLRGQRHHARRGHHRAARRARRRGLSPRSGRPRRRPERDPRAAAQPLSGPAAWRRRASAHGSSSASRRSGSKENGGASSPAAASSSRSDAPASGPGRSAPSSAPRRMSKLGSRSSSATTTNADALW